MGDRGRLVVPVDLRERLGYAPGTALILIETAQGVVMATREQLKDIVRVGLGDLDLVGELISERRRAAAADLAE